jgi:hypothetical protein
MQSLGDGWIPDSARDSGTLARPLLFCSANGFCSRRLPFRGIGNHPSGSRLGARSWRAASIIPRRPDLIRAHADGFGHQSLHCGPLLSERFTSSGRMIAVRHRQPGETVPTLLQRGQNVGGMPIGDLGLVALALIPCIHCHSLERNVLLESAVGRSKPKCKTASWPKSVETLRGVYDECHVRETSGA